MGKGRLYSQMSFIYKYETLGCFMKGVSGGCFLLINKSSSGRFQILLSVAVDRTWQTPMKVAFIAYTLRHPKSCTLLMAIKL